VGKNTLVWEEMWQQMQKGFVCFVITHSSMRENVLGIEAVLPNGTVVNTLSAL
jgi:hypothetical protein